MPLSASTPTHRDVSPSKMVPYRFSVANRLSHVSKNLHHVMKDYGRNLLQDPPTLKNNSLIVSMLFLVLARIYITWHTALKARGTQEAAYRNSEAIKTTIREAVGWVLSYMVLRAIQRATEAVIRKPFGIAKSKSLMVYSMGRAKQAIQSGWQGAEVSPFRLEKSHAFKIDNNQKMVNAYKQWHIAKLFNDRLSIDEKLHIPKDIVPGTTPDGVVTLLEKIRGRVKNIYIWLPIIVGSIPAIALSGYVLERYTQNHSKEVVEAINRKKNPELVKPKYFKPNGTVQQNFNAYFNHIQQAQSQRQEF